MTSFWDEVYSENPYAYGETPNGFFAACLDQLARGTLLLPGEGPGRNALYAAGRGWTVTAFDASPVAVEQACSKAEELGLEIDFRQATYDDFAVEGHRFSALAFIFTHQPNTIRRAMHRRFLTCLQPGGHLIAEYYHRDQLELGTGGPKDLGMLYELDDLKEDFPEIHFQVAEHVEVELSEGSMHRGRSSLLRLFGQKAES